MTMLHFFNYLCIGGGPVAVASALNSALTKTMINPKNIIVKNNYCFLV